MNEAFDKILERLDEELRKSEERYYRYLDDSNLPCMFDKSDIEEKRVDTIKEMLEIVQEVAEEFATDTNVGTNGWIPCSEKLPELRQNVLVTVKYTGFMGMHGYWIKTGHMEVENDWWGDCAGGDVIAWQPLPEPFKECD